MAMTKDLITRFNNASISEADSTDDDAHTSAETDLSSGYSTTEEQEKPVEIDHLLRRLTLAPKAHGPSLSTLPPELQYEIFSHLDNIDSACLGLTSPAAYVIFRRIHGTRMSLTTRRIGPNKLEAAWDGRGPDKQACQHCGAYRCQLYQHIKTWVPADLEYCAMKGNFGRPAEGAAKGACYRGKPSKPRRCGRHPIRTTTVHETDSLAPLTSSTCS